jgi:hypothetical protein
MAQTFATAGESRKTGFRGEGQVVVGQGDPKRAHDEARGDPEKAEEGDEEGDVPDGQRKLKQVVEQEGEEQERRADRDQPEEAESEHQRSNLRPEQVDPLRHP